MLDCLARAHTESPSAPTTFVRMPAEGPPRLPRFVPQVGPPRAPSSTLTRRSQLTIPASPALATREREAVHQALDEQVEMHALLSCFAL